MPSPYYEEVPVEDFKKKIEDLSDKLREGSAEFVLSVLKAQNDESDRKRWSYDENGKIRRGKR